jgi:zona occludens toxin (predicted ATPase)
MTERDEPVRKNVYLQPIHVRVADDLAKDGGHSGFTRLIQALLIDAAIRLYGPKWRDRFEEERDAA